MVLVSDSVYRRVLGVELDTLAPELRPYFDGGQRIGVGSGVFEVAGRLSAVRTFHFAGRDRPLQDEMRVVDGRLHDFLGRRGGFEVRLALTVADGRMRLRSDRQWLNVAGLRIRIPALATVTVDESWSDGAQHVDVRLRTPLLGDWFRYAGHFTYSYQPR